MFTGIVMAMMMGVGDVSLLQLAQEKAAEQQLRRVHELALDGAKRAETLGVMMMDTKHHPQGHRVELQAIREDINEMGKLAAALEKHREVLPAAERLAIERMMPALRDVAKSEASALEFFNANQSRLWLEEDREYARRMARDFDQVAAVVGNALQLERMIEKENVSAVRLQEAVRKLPE